MAVHRNPHRCSRNPDAVILQYFASFVDHLHLFFGIAVVEKSIDMGQTVKRNAVRINIFLIVQKIDKGTGLIKKLIDGFFSGPGNGLIG